MPYLFDTDAISEVLKPRPSQTYLEWLRSLPAEEQYTSAMCVAELYWGACRSPTRDRHLVNIVNRVLPTLQVLPFDAATARHYGEIKAILEKEGLPLADADLLIAATAIQHDLELVTGNVRHFGRIPGLLLNHTFAEARGAWRPTPARR